MRRRCRIAAWDPRAEASTGTASRFPPPEKGPYFQDLFPYVRDNTKIDLDLAGDLLGEQYDAAWGRPWKEKDYPLLAEWLRLGYSMIQWPVFLLPVVLAID